MWVSTTKLAKLEGVTTQTIRRKIESGFYKKVKLTDGGHFRVFITEQKIICYARVSSSKQKSNIDTQQQILLERYPNAEFVSDVASAFNFKRKGMQAILESAMLGNAIHLVATNKDRIAKSGFEFVKWLVELSGGRIEILDKKDNTSESLNAAELIGFITSFCNSHYGNGKKHKDNNKKE